MSSYGHQNIALWACINISAKLYFDNFFLQLSKFILSLLSDSKIWLPFSFPIWKPREVSETLQEGYVSRYSFMRSKHGQNLAEAADVIDDRVWPKRKWGISGRICGEGENINKTFSVFAPSKKREKDGFVYSIQLACFQTDRQTGRQTHSNRLLLLLPLLMRIEATHSPNNCFFSSSSSPCFPRNGLGSLACWECGVCRSRKEKEAKKQQT